MPFRAVFRALVLVAIAGAAAAFTPAPLQPLPRSSSNHAGRLRSSPIAKVNEPPSKEKDLLAIDWESLDLKSLPETGMQTIKSAGIAGVLSYFVVELSFFAVALPAGYVAYHAGTGTWLDLGVLLEDGEGRVQLLGIIATYVVLLKTLFPLRLGATLLLTPRMKQLLAGLRGLSQTAQK